MSSLAAHRRWCNPVDATNIANAFSTGSEAVAATSGATAPDFILSNFKGTHIFVADFRGTVVILDFWPTWCPTCKREKSPSHQTLNGVLIQGLQVVDIAFDQPDKVRMFAQQNGMNCPIHFGNDQIASLYEGIEGISATFVVNNTGDIINRFVGFTSKEDFDAEINKLL